MGEVHKCSIDKFRGDTLGSIHFSPLKTSPPQGNLAVNNRHVNRNSPLVETIEALSGNVFLCMQSPNKTKAIVTINAETTEILIANTLATQLLGIGSYYTSVKLSDFILSPEDKFLFSKSDLNPNGELVLFSGKVMDLINSSKQVIPVSVWARKIESDSDFRCVVVMEPVDRITATVKFDHNGKIVSCDENFISVFGFSDPGAATNANITDLIPNVEFGLENNQVNSKQCITGRNGGFIFPLSIQINLCSKEKVTEDDIQEELFYEGTIWVFSNISGLITLLPDGTIHSCNTNFSLLFFGYTQDELVGKNISYIIPSFYNENEYFDTDSVALPPFDDEDDSSSKCGTSDGRITADSTGTDPPRPMNPIPFSPYMRDDYQKMVSYSFGEGHSASSSQFSFNQPSPVDHSNQQQESSHLDTSALTPPLMGKHNEDTNSSEHELSASSFQRSRHLSYSESLDTLHSGTNSITGSDINANFYGTGDGRVSIDAANNTPSECSYSPSEDSSHEPDSSSESGDEEESSREEDKDDQYSFCSHESDSDKDDKESFLLPSNMSVTELNSLSCKERTHSTCLSDCDIKCAGLLTRISTPRDVNLRPLSDNSSRSLEGGEFIGLGRHRDGTNIAIMYYLKKVTLDDGKYLHCLWVSHDSEEMKSSPISKARNDNVRTRTQETAETKSDCETSTCGDASESSVLSDSVYVEGEFSDKYTIIEHLRKGAFGCIKRTYRNSDGLLVISKFIRKSEIYADSWVDDNQLNKKVPLEISILNTVDHPNIVKVLDVFENDVCFQMIMEKHGNGLDLFEFIERRAVSKMDEPLASYIFRQIVSALSYLHGLSILHRDIKDENLIIDERFHVKLIDFGSAAFMKEGKLFSTFCGTMEYCSPEVIRGNKYRGPELEMFALGVTLYTIMAGENPFIGADEILLGEYDVPSRWTEELVDLVAHLLEPDPKERATLSEVENNCWVNQPVYINQYKFEDIVGCENLNLSLQLLIKNSGESNSSLKNIMVDDDLHPAKYFQDLNLKSESSETTTDSDTSFLSSRMSNVRLEDMRRSLTESGL
ncbi:UNVERIFIED_CONTAM: PAS domain-containing serine/threonine-protein kinase [Trichonephila clavipes]